MADVAIVGVGLHPFGRFPGKTALRMGADAARLALADAGLSWRDIQFAIGGSYEVDQPDAVVAEIGLTEVQFTNVYRARCRTRYASCRGQGRTPPTQTSRSHPRSLMVVRSGVQECRGPRPAKARTT